MNLPVPTVLLLTAMLGCTAPARVDQRALHAFVHDPENGLTKQRTVNGIRTSVTLLPPELTALRELNSWDPDSCSIDRQGVLERHRDMLCFTLDLAPDQVHRTGDVMYTDVRGIEEFKAQAMALNFNWEEMLELRCGGHIYHPVLSTLENTYGLTDSRKVIVAFVGDTIDDPAFRGAEELVLVMNDHVLGTGKQHFRFERDALANVPQPTL